MKRRAFLTEYLGALGAKEIDWFQENEYSIYGRVIYEFNDPEEVQDFCWHLKENEVPNNKVKDLAKLLKEKELLNTDKILIPKAELLAIYNKKYSSTFSLVEFQPILDTLKNIEVPMIDKGKETDAYFIHE